MYKIILILITIIISIKCTNRQEGRFSEIKCIPTDSPKYDYRGTIKGELTPKMDSILRIEKRRDIFKPCRELTYLATFLNSDNKLITESKIRLIASGKRWEYQTEKQDEVIFQYEFTEEDIQNCKKYQLNKLLNRQWVSSTKVGIIENVEQIWMHPFRANQYNFTEVTPFPQVELPLRIGKTWTEKIYPKEGYGEWSNKTVVSDFKVVSKESIKLDYGELKDCWKISAKSVFELGESYLEYWFNEELGFVKFDYINYGNQKLKIELQSVKNK